MSKNINFQETGPTYIQKFGWFRLTENFYFALYTSNIDSSFKNGCSVKKPSISMDERFLKSDMIYTKHEK